MRKNEGEIQLIEAAAAAKKKKKKKTYAGTFAAFFTSSRSGSCVM